MKKDIVLIIIYLFIYSCNGQNNSMENNIDKIYDSQGRIKEEFGYSSSDDVYFRLFYYYNAENKLIKKRYYFFENDNKNCIVTEKDLLNYSETVFSYFDNKIAWERKYSPVVNNITKKIELKLIYSRNHITGEEIIEE
jgi:hypothetical protein